MSEKQDSSQQVVDAATTLFQKIRSSLTSGDPGKWKEYGHAHDPRRKYPKPIEYLEHILVREIPAGLLVLRCSLRVGAQFHGGGYVLTPLADPVFTVELRETSWDARDLTEPNRRGALSQTSSKKGEVLTSGQPAFSLFMEVGRQLAGYYREKFSEFEKLSKEILRELEDIANNGLSEAWDKRVEGKGSITWYRSKVMDHRIDVGKQMKREGIMYRLIITSRFGFNKVIDTSLAKRLFDIADIYEKSVGLHKLDALLGSLDGEKS